VIKLDTRLAKRARARTTGRLVLQKVLAIVRLASALSFRPC
jgi:hypothetical protein